ncbi:porin [uncultured Bacteroides sp.]|uniref:porin n=1 Tax=uncultured Bacteroides sp. TaxID=162156 RepID=UPI002AA7178F|nr:porin [uncultured Bacteroides sp.]
MKKQLFAFSALCFMASHHAYALDPQSSTSTPAGKQLTLSSVEDNFKLSFSGRIQADGAMFFGEDYQPLGNGVGFRRIRLGTTAVFGDNLSGMMEVDFTDGGFSLKDCYIKYDLPHGLNLRAGNAKEGFSMDAMTSSAICCLWKKRMCLLLLLRSIMWEYRLIGREISF